MNDSAANSPNESTAGMAELPTSVDSAVTMAKELNAMPAEAREARIDTMRSGMSSITGAPEDESSRAWLDVLEAIYHPADEKGPRIKSILQQIERSGASREDAKLIAGRFAALDAVQEPWSRWTELADRDELRLRLEVLARCERLDESLVPFITFFFRASVADLYQAAAIALGRHLYRSPKLREYLQHFAEQRGLALDRPVTLNGQRPARRLLLALTAARYHAAAQKQTDASMSLPECPIAMADEDEDRRFLMPENAADLAILLVAVDLAVTAAEPDEAVLRAARRLLESIADARAPAGGSALIVTRSVVQRFGTVLAHLLQRVDQDAEPREQRLIDGWWRLLENQWEALRGRQDGDFARRVAGLNRIDETIRTLAFLPDGSSRELAHRLRDDLSGDQRRFSIARLLIWCPRERSDRPEWLTSLHRALQEDTYRAVNEVTIGRAGDGAMNAPAVLQLVERTLRAVERGGPDVFRLAADYSAELIAALLAEMESAARWLSHDEQTRSLITFHLLDQMQHTRLSPEQYLALLRRYGLVSAAAAPRGIDRLSRYGSESGAPNFATTAVILRLLTWEKPGAEDFLDTRMLHRIDDQRVLLALLPTRRKSAVLDVLADAFEHQFRWRLRSDPDFSLEAFLYQTTVRRPHRTFYLALQSICTGRTYSRGREETIDVIPILQHLAEEDTAADSSAASSGEVFAGDPSFAKTVSRLRDRLLRLTDSEIDLRARLGEFAEAIGETATSAQLRRGTLLGLLGRIHPTSEPLLQEGYPAWSEQTLADLEEHVGRLGVRLKPLVSAMLPAQWTEADEVREAVAELRSLCHRLCEALLRSTPATEARMIEAARDRFDHELREWMLAIEQVMERWPEGALRGPEPKVDAADGALESIRMLHHLLLRRHLLELLWQSLRAWARGDAPAAADHPHDDDRHDAWDREKRLLDWALGHGPPANPPETRPGMWPAEADQWLHTLAETWNALATSAMDRQQEQRVTDLMREPSYERIRRSPMCRETVAAVRRWCFDRYLWETSKRAATDLRVNRNQRPPTLIGHAAAFFAHFSAIWLALLIGSILMLDFGDAWAEMADPEIGDIRGIALTFIVGVAGTFIYLHKNLRDKTQRSPGQSRTAMRRSLLARAGGFMVPCAIYAVAVTSIFWWLLSRTDEVVHGPWAIGHIIVWSGFALFIGVFFGLIGGGKA